MATMRVNTKELIDGNRFGPYQIGVFLLCFLAAAIDGYDVQVIGVAISGIRDSLNLQPATMGVILTAGQIGVMLGAFCLGPVADRIGRKRMMTLTALIFGVFSLLTAFATTVGEIAAMRLLAGIGLGGIVPAALAYGSEYAPQRLRATITTLVWMALPVGGMIAGFSAVWLLPAFGWQSLFIVAGVMPLALALVLAFAMPESLAYLSARDGDQAQMRKIAVHIAPSLAGHSDIVFFAAEEKLAGVPLKHLFKEGRAAGTVLLWMIFFLSFFLMIFFVSWIPTFIRTATGSTTALGTSLAMWNFGSLIATAMVGQLIDRFGYYRILPGAFILIALATWSLGFFVTAPVGVLFFLIATVGFVTGGSNSGLMALASNSYPVAIRSTGVGAAYSLGGRSGALAGPMLGALLLQYQWSPSAILYVIGAPMLLGAVILLLLQRQAHFRHAVVAPASVPAPVEA
jgi:MFS transporter, AAHS family, 4-hydroxybenzoate transporter